jgi:DNA-directed RNA polymerase I, II, and III subunit RPABC1
MNVAEEVYKSFSTIRDMLGDRGRNVTKFQEYQFEEIREVCNSKSVFTLDDQNEGLRVVYNINPKFKLNDVKRFLEEDFKVIILVTKESLSSANVKQLVEFGPHVEAFDVSELLFNISRHDLVPKHEAVTDDQEIAQIMETYRVKSRHQLPLILRNDPMARYLGLKPGHLVRITRTSPTAGEYILYRACA